MHLYVKLLNNYFQNTLLFQYYLNKKLNIKKLKDYFINKKKFNSKTK